MAPTKMLVHVLHRQGGDQAETFTQFTFKETRLKEEFSHLKFFFFNLTDQQVEADELTIVNYCPFRDTPEANI